LGKFKEIKFEFIQKPKDVDDKIDSLISIIRTLKKENESLKIFKEQNEKHLNIISFFFSFLWKEKIFQHFYSFTEDFMKSNIIRSGLSIIVNKVISNKKKLPQEFQILLSARMNFLYRASENGDKISQIYKVLNEFSNKLEVAEAYLAYLLTLIKVGDTIILIRNDDVWKIKNDFQPINNFSTVNCLVQNLIDGNHNENNKIKVELNNDNNENKDNEVVENDKEKDKDNDKSEKIIDDEGKDNEQDFVETGNVEKGIFFSKEKIMIGENYIEINDNFFENNSCSIKQPNNKKFPKINKIFDLKDKNCQNYSFKIDEMEIICFYKENE